MKGWFRRLVVGPVVGGVKSLLSAVGRVVGVAATGALLGAWRAVYGQLRAADDTGVDEGVLARLARDSNSGGENSGGENSGGENSGGSVGVAAVGATDEVDGAGSSGWRSVAWRAAVAVGVVGAVGWLLRPPPRPSVFEGLVSFDEPEPVEGFGTVWLPVHTAQGRRVVPVLLAVTSEQIAQGLAGRTDLAGHAGMLLLFPSVTSVPLHMRNTPLPLSAVWIGESGEVLGQTMLPAGGPDDERLWSPPSPVRAVLEVPQGVAAVWRPTRVELDGLIAADGSGGGVAGGSGVEEDGGGAD